MPQSLSLDVKRRRRCYLKPKKQATSDHPSPRKKRSKSPAALFYVGRAECRKATRSHVCHRLAKASEPFSSGLFGLDEPRPRECEQAAADGVALRILVCAMGLIRHRKTSSERTRRGVFLA